MNHTNYVIAAYAIGLGLMWGYALVVWMGLRKTGGRP